MAERRIVQIAAVADHSVGATEWRVVFGVGASPDLYAISCFLQVLLTRPQAAELPVAGQLFLLAVRVLHGACARSRLPTPRHFELLEHAMHVILHRRELDAERAGDFLVGQTLLDEGENLALAKRQSSDGGFERAVVAGPTRRQSMEQRRGQ